jgi:thymidine kinase
MNSYAGSITTIVGPMFGGKTSRLISEKRRNEIAGKRVVLIKHCMDTRYGKGDKVATHDNIRETSYVSRSGEKLFECGLGIEELIRSFEVVCIDEGQFYEDVDEFSETLANKGIKVYCSALLGDYNRKPFPVISRLMALSEDIIFTKAVDRKTGEDASFTKRKRGEIPSEAIFGNNFVVGSTDKYEAADRKTYFES